MSTTGFRDFLKSGAIKGYFTDAQFWSYYDQLLAKYPDRVGQRVALGQTYQGQNIWGFYFGKHLQGAEQGLERKNIVFITGLHHSREPLTVTMVLYLMVRILDEVGECGGGSPALKEKWRLFFNNNVIFFIPIVNADSYRYIGQNWQGPHGADVLMIRKNRNISPRCDEFTGGVDLNRNYSFMFALNDSGSSGDPCQEDFRGSRPFSEPETQTIKRFVDEHPHIVTGINMHTYGNAWIFPFNFVHDSRNQLLRQRKPKFYNFYREFVEDMRHKHENAEFGNAQGTVQYPTNGEAGDWLTATHNIINLDVELGDTDKRSDQFYPPRSIIPGICAHNFQVFREFFWKHNIHLMLHQVKRNRRKKTLTFIIFNKSISSLIDFTAEATPVFGKKRSRKLRKKKARAKKRKSAHGKRNKRKFKLKEGRLLSSGQGFHIDYAIKPKSTLRAEDFHRADNATLKGTLHGRHYLEIQFTFDDSAQLDSFKAVDLDVHYGRGYVKKYQFLTHNKKRRMLSHSRSKRLTQVLRQFGLIQERRLREGPPKLTERQRQRAQDRPKLVV